MDSLEPLIKSLRRELTQYGELLALLETQQQAILARDTDQVQDCATLIRSQTQHLERLKTNREELRNALFSELSLDPSTPFTESLEQLPAHYRPLLEALQEENRTSINRIRRLARQNHLLLTRSLSTVHQLLNTLSDDGSPTTYGNDGRLPYETRTRAFAYDHVC